MAHSFIEVSLKALKRFTPYNYQIIIALIFAFYFSISATVQSNRTFVSGLEDFCMMLPFLLQPTYVIVANKYVSWVRTFTSLFMYFWILAEFLVYVVEGKGMDFVIIGMGSVFFLPLPTFILVMIGLNSRANKSIIKPSD